MDATQDSPLHASPALYVVATPLGNLADISRRALSVLGAVELIAAEDTRHSQRLLDAVGVRTRLLAVHEHNEQEGATRLIAALQAGQHVAMITDAGTPAVSDPGAKVVRRVQEAGFAVVPVPGACAAVAALSASGLLENSFRFIGFLSPKSAARRKQLGGFLDEPGALVFYEAPHRILECVADIAAVMQGERELVIARELTKRFEQIVRLPVGEALAWLQADPDHQRGEFVLLLSGAQAQAVEGVPAEAQRVLKLLLAEMPVKTAARLAAEITGAPKNQLYALALELKDGA